MIANTAKAGQVVLIEIAIEIADLKMNQFEDLKMKIAEIALLCHADA
jgi:hypothetical protein